MEPRKQRRFTSIVVSLIVGLTVLGSLLGRPRVQAYRTVDIIEFVASGMCFGIAFSGILRNIRGSA